MCLIFKGRVNNFESVICIQKFTEYKAQKSIKLDGYSKISYDECGVK